MITEIDVTRLEPKDAYKILTGTVVPRPIAWVSTVGVDGVFNLAPFSFFTAVCSNPPTVLFCPVTPQTLQAKDTLRNVRDTGQFVINVGTEELAAKLNQTSAPYPPGVSEFDAVALTPLKGVKVAAPRVAESPVQLECELTQIVDIGDGTPGSGHIVIGRVVYAHFAPGVADDRLHLDISKINPVSRLTGNDYAPVRDIFSLTRPMSVG